MKSRILIALFVAASTALAGCLQAENGGAGGKDGNGDGAGPDQPIPTTGEARSLLASSSGEAAFEKLDRVGLKGNFSSDEGNGEFHFAHSKADGAWLFRVKMSQGATTFGIGAAQKGTTGNFFWGEKTYVTRDEVPETGSVFEALDNFSRQNPYGGSDDEDEGGAKTDTFLGGAMDGYIIDSVTPTTYKGKGAFVVKAHNDTNTVDATFYLDRRPAAFTFTTEQGGKSQTGTFEILYGNEVAIVVSTSGERTSFSLMQESEDASTETQKITRGIVSDSHREEVKLGEIEMRAVYQDGEPGRFGEPGPGTVVAKMTLTEGTKTSEGVTFTYNDVDGDGFVSAGDTYEFTSDDMEATLMFYDTWADMYEGKPNIPFPGALALLAVLGVAAFLARRRL